MKNIVRTIARKILPGFLKKILRKIFIPPPKPRTYVFYQNLGVDLCSCQKRVLLSYITAPLETSQSAWSRHVTISVCAQIIRCLLNMGFVVDVAHCRDQQNKEAMLAKEYDVIFGFGHPYYEASLKWKNVPKIIYLTESHPDFLLTQETVRLQYFESRHQKKLPLARAGAYYKNEHIAIADYGILVGNQVTAKTYAHAFAPNRLFPLTTMGAVNPNYTPQPRDCKITRKNFLWFGSFGAVHKGLDILFDVFEKTPEYHLYICGLDSYERPYFTNFGTNVHLMDFVWINSQAFVDLMNQCSFVIFPSCAEGMSTSVLTCMNHGLIPLISRETGIDLPEIGMYLEDYKTTYIQSVVDLWANMPPDRLQTEHQRVFEYARSYFTIHAYAKRLQAVLAQVFGLCSIPSR